MTEHDDGAVSRPRRRAAERLLGAAAEPSAPRPERVRSAAPRTVRWAALVVGLQAAVALGTGGLLVYLAATGSGDVGNDLALAATVAVFGVLLAVCAVGLWRVARWARSPVVAMQIIFGLMGLTAITEAHSPAFGVPVLVLVALEFYLLATPEARLAFYPRTDA